MALRDFDKNALHLAYRRMLVGKEELLGYVRGRMEDICSDALAACPEGSGVSRMTWHTELTVSGDDTFPFTLSAEIRAEADRDLLGLPPLETMILERKYIMNTNPERLRAFLDSFAAEAVGRMKMFRLTNEEMS